MNNKSTSQFVSVCANKCVRTKTEFQFNGGKLAAGIKENLLFYVLQLADASGSLTSLLCAPWSTSDTKSLVSVL